MAGFLYYLADRNEHIRAADACAAGLGYAFEQELTPRGVQRGPNELGSGVVFAVPGSVADLAVGYFPEQQRWRSVPGTEVWVGMYVDEQRPGPTDLQRQRMLPGHPVRLADGRNWLIPVARAAVVKDDRIVENAYQIALAQRSSLDEEGNWQAVGVVPAYAELWEIALRWWDALFPVSTDAEIAESGARSREGEQRAFDFAGEHDAALAALAANYRVGRAEVDLLELFDQQCVGQILQALIDWPTWVHYLSKKAAAGGSSSADGSPASIPATGPA